MGWHAILNIAGIASFSSNHAVHPHTELIRNAIPLGGESVEANRVGDATSQRPNEPT